jgi:hypothetical protein
MEPNPNVRTKTFTISVKDLSDTEPRTLMMTGSTESPDRDKDILMSSGWGLDNYVKNPVVLWAHNYQVPAVAVAKSVYSDKRNKRLEFKLYFPTIGELCSDPSNPSDHALFVDTLYHMYKSGMMNASSVGYLGHKMEPRKDQEDQPVWNRGLVFTDQELVELSLVPVPANAEALVQARSMKSLNQHGVDIVEKAMLDETSKKGAEDMADKLTEEEVERLKAFALTLPKKEEPKKKAGRKLSASSLAKINAAMDHVNQCMDALKGLVSDGVVETDEDESDGVEGEKEKPGAEPKPGEEKPGAEPKPGEEKPGAEPKPGEEKPGKEKALDLSTMTVEQANDILRLGGNHEGA